MRRHRLIPGLLALLLCAAACGGADEGGSASPTTAARGEGEIVLGGDIPDYFPADFYFPEGISIRGISQSPATNMISLTGTFESGDPTAIQADVVAGLQAAGYELLTNDEIAAFVKDGVGRVRVRTREFLGELTMTVDIDTWTDEQIAELRALFAEEVVVAGRATARYGDEMIEADGECILKGTSRAFYAEDVSISLQIDETRDPVFVYADVTTGDGRVFTIDAASAADPQYESAPDRFTARGDMTEYLNEDAGTIGFSIEAFCDV